MHKKGIKSEVLEITDQPVEFKCSICYRTVTYPSPESAILDLNILIRAKIFSECTKCHQIVCKNCTSDKKQNICKNCFD